MIFSPLYDTLYIMRETWELPIYTKKKRHLNPFAQSLSCGVLRNFPSLSRENLWETTMPSSTASSSSFTTSLFTCCSASSPSNLERFLQCVTPHVPSQTLPKVFHFLFIYFISFSLFLFVFKYYYLSLWVDSLCSDSSDGAFVCLFVLLWLFIFIYFFNSCNSHI